MMRHPPRARRGLFLPLAVALASVTVIAGYYRAVAEDVPTRSATGADLRDGVIRVANRAELMRALRDRAGGFTIELAPGEYGSVRLRAEADAPLFAQPVTIRSAEPCNRARFSSLTLSGVSRITLEALHFENSTFFGSPPDVLYVRPGRLRSVNLLRTDRVSNITIRDSLFVGPTVDLGAGHPENGYGYGFGWKGSDIRDATFVNNEMTNLYKGLSISRTERLEVSGNSVHDYRSDAFYIAGSKDLVVTDNFLINPRPRILPQGRGDHPDFMQMRDIYGARIENNYMDVGTGGSGSQGIFVFKPSADLVVRNNVIASRGRNALTFSTLENSEIANNLVIHAEVPAHLRERTGARAPDAPMLRIRPSYRNVRVSRNAASLYNREFDGLGPAAGGGNVLVQNAVPGGRNFYYYDAAGTGAPAPQATQYGRVWLAGVPAGVGPDPSAFAFVANGTERGPAACRRPNMAAPGAPARSAAARS
jgi:hypothetical protein